MTSATTTSARTADDVARPRRASAARRVGSLTRAEILLLARNRTTLFNALALAPGTVAFLAVLGADTFLSGSDADRVGTYVLTSLAAVALIFVVYYNLTTTLVARREELVLKRLLTGEVTRVEVVVACATPAVAILLAQLVLGAVAVGVWFELPPVAGPVQLVAGLVAGVAVFVLLAVVSSGLTRTVESAQLTTLPVIVPTMVLSGIAMPLSVLPDALQTVASWTPMAPVVRLLETGLGAGDPSLAGDTWATTTQPLLALAVWLAVGAWAAARWMRWEPRR